MQFRYLFITVAFVLVVFTACNQDAESEELKEKPKTEKIQMVEKLIDITYVDVYLDQNLFVGGNPDTGLGNLPFQCDDIVYLPVNVFAEKNNLRNTEWNKEKKELNIGKANTYSQDADYRFPEIFPTQINISYGGITLFMQEEEITLDKSEQLLVYESTVYANAELLCEIFDKKMERCEMPIETSSGILQYDYLNISNDLSKDVNIATNYIESVYKLLHP